MGEVRYFLVIFFFLEENMRYKVNDILGVVLGEKDYVAVKVLEVNEEEGAYSVLEVVDGVEYINELYDDEENIYLISTGDSIREK